MRVVLVGALLAALVVAGSSSAAAASATPASIKLEIKALLSQIGAGELAIVPTRLPRHFAYESYSVTGSPMALDVSFADRRFMATSDQAREHGISFNASYFKQALSRCGTGARKTFRVAGVKVYSDGATVWRCVLTRGRVVKEAANGRAADTALAMLVLYARPIV